VRSPITYAFDRQRIVADDDTAIATTILATLHHAGHRVAHEFGAL
jgi:hypothetical protein